jgi:GTP-binding nuclear protein Ran
MSIMKKIVMIGDCGVGKTSLVNLWLTDVFTSKYNPTLGINVHPINVNNTTYNVWDCAGQEKYGGRQESYYIGMDGIIIMFDLTTKLSFKSVPEYIKKIKQNFPDIKILLCGNKSDGNRKVSLELIENFCSRNLLQYCEISAKHDINCDTVLQNFN